LKVKKITAAEFREMVAVSSDRLNNNADFINSLNVFPVPDGDTGTNMSLSFASGAKYVAESTADDVGTLAAALAKGLLMGARGNSGVILSQIFRGFHKSTEKKVELTPADLAAALSSGVESAYKAVMKPTEGTILTVARQAAKAANKTSNQTDVTTVMSAAYSAAKEALAHTPEQLPVLKEVGVVDSGGQGLTFVYEGFAAVLSGKTLAEPTEKHQPNMVEMDEMVNAAHHQSVQSQLNTEDIHYGYCTEIMVRLGAGRLVDQKFDYDAFRQHLSEIGDSLLVVADEQVVKVHVHTEHPGDVLAYGQHFGSLIKVKVDNMRLQHETILEHDREADSPSTTEPTEPATVETINGYGIIAIASGVGLGKLFKSLGATLILNGGQTMNPSTEDIVQAIKQTKAKKVIILPNNKNIFLAANQAAQVAEVAVAVVPSKTVAQGMTSLLSFDSQASLKENQAKMTAELDSVISGQITTAVRDTSIDGQTIKKDDFMAIVDGKIVLTNAVRKTAAISMLKRMLTADSEIVTIIYGADGNQEEAQEIAAAAQQLDSDLEIEVHFGGQPVYPYLISVE
jgi:DAK2 domain fusion protein YloV